jgi:hypothetical protein
VSPITGRPRRLNCSAASQADGFSRARTVHSELFALAIEHTSWTPRTAVIVDEAAMLDTRLMAMVTAWAADAGAKLILAGDDRPSQQLFGGTLVPKTYEKRRKEKCPTSLLVH